MPVTIRLLDVGGDKQIPYLDQPREDNPFLGVRALRLADRRPDLFVTQLRACLRAAVAGPVKVMAPMIADASDAARLHELAHEARVSLDRDGVAYGEVALGVMLEIPSAVLTGDTYLDQLAFASLGTNDLLQYTLAADRGNAALDRYRDSLHPALLRLVRESVEACGRAGVELSVCGEMAGDPAAALALVGLGVRQLSMSAPGLAAVRRAIRSADAGALQAAAAAALRDPGAAEARARFDVLLAGTGAGDGLVAAGG
jgi:phosphoenolpyruvate-protein kinase (PTS system EI component)